MLATILALCLPLLQPPAEVAPTPRPVKPEAKKELPVGAFRFRSVGPAVTSGRVVGLAVHPQKPNTYYVAVACGGVWKTVNNGTTWTPVFDEQGSYSIGTVTLDPSNPETVWVGSGENNSQRSVAYGDGVYKSTDGGNTWANVGLKASEHVAKIHIDPKDPLHVTVAAQGPLWSSGGERGLYQTRDGGKVWTKLLHIDDDTGVTDFVVDPAAPATILAASYQRRRHVWTLVNGGPGSGIHRTTDGGKTWTKVAAGLPTGDLGRIGLAAAPSDPKTVYAVVEANDKAGGIFKSTDGGATWAKQNPFDQQGQYYSHLVVDPHDKDRLYAMNVNIQVSDDGGKTLKSLGGQFKHVDNHTIWVNPADANHYRVGCDGGLYESTDRAATWAFKANLPVTQFYDAGVDQNPASGPFYHVYGGTQDNFTLGGPGKNRSVHGTMNSDWYVVQGGDGFHCTSDPTDPDTIYGEFQYGGLCRYDRRTGTRVEIQPLAAPGAKPLRWNWDSPMILSPHDPKRVYFAANLLFRSDDRGDNWKPVSPDLTRQLDRDRLKVFGKIQSPDAVSKHVSTSFYGNIVALTESPVKEGVLYAGTDDGLIQASPDGGQSWTKRDAFPGVPERTYVSKLVASRHTAGTVYAAFDNHKMGDFKPYLLKSTDGGTTWTSLAAGLPERGSVYCLAEDHVNADLLFIGTEFGLYVTTDGGKTWARMKNNLPTIQVKDLVIQRANNDLVVATFGRGFYVLDDYSPLRTLTVEAPAKPTLVGPKAALLYHTTAQFGGAGKAFLGAALYTGEAAAPGPTFTVRHGEVFKPKKQLRTDAEKAAVAAKKEIDYPKLEDLRAEAEEEAPSLVLTVADSTGEVVRRVAVPAGEGVHRITWDLHAAGFSTTDDLAGGGPLVTPGDYRVTLVKRANGTTTALTDAVAVTLTPDPLSPMKSADYADIAAFNKQHRALQRRLYATTTAAGELATKLDAVKVALDAAPKPDEPARKRVREVIERLKASRRTLTGDAFLAGRNENVPMSIGERVRAASGATDDAFARPTGTARQAATDAAKQLEDELVKLHAIQDDELPKLEAAAGVTAPGRLPK